MRGIIWEALKDWHLKSNKSIIEILKMPIANRLNEIKDIFCLSNKILKQMIKQPESKEEIIIDIAFEKALKYYLYNIDINIY